MSRKVSSLNLTGGVQVNIKPFVVESGDGILHRIACRNVTVSGNDSASIVAGILTSRKAVCRDTSGIVDHNGNAIETLTTKGTTTPLTFVRDIPRTVAAESFAAVADLPTTKLNKLLAEHGKGEESADNGTPVNRIANVTTNGK